MKLENEKKNNNRKDLRYKVKFNTLIINNFNNTLTTTLIVNNFNIK